MTLQVSIPSSVKAEIFIVETCYFRWNVYLSKTKILKHKGYASSMTIQNYLWNTVLLAQHVILVSTFPFVI